VERRAVEPQALGRPRDVALHLRQHLCYGAALERVARVSQTLARKDVRRRLARLRGRRPKTFAPEAISELARRRWRGNVRELQNLVERVLLMSTGPTVKLEDLPPDEMRAPQPGEPPPDILPGQSLADARDTFERRAIAKVLSEMKGNVSRAAERLGLDRTTLHRRLKTWGLDAEKE
jgi:two-component system nitrogen regulation response regulator NtrX